MNFLILSLVLLYSLPTHDQASDLWEQPEFVSELKSNIWDTVDWGKKWFVDFNAAKTLFRLTSLITLMLLMWKWMGLFLIKIIFQDAGVFSLLNWIGALKLSLLLKLPLRKLVPWFVLWSSFLLRLLYKCTIGPCIKCCHVGAGPTSYYLELLGALKNGYVGLLIFTCCLFWSLGSSSKWSQLKSFIKILLWKYSPEIAELVPLPYSSGMSTRYSNRLHDFSVTNSRCYEDVCQKVFYSQN